MKGPCSFWSEGWCPITFRRIQQVKRSWNNSNGKVIDLNFLLSFAEEHKTDNKLFAAINSDLNMLPFQAGARALGIISKMVTGPMWRFLEKEDHVSELSPVYQQMYSVFKRLFTDASDLLKGEYFLFGDTVYKQTLGGGGGCFVNQGVYVFLGCFYQSQKEK